MARNRRYSFAVAVPVEVEDTRPYGPLLSGDTGVPTQIGCSGVMASKLKDKTAGGVRDVEARSLRYYDPLGPTGRKDADAAE